MMLKSVLVSLGGLAALSQATVIKRTPANGNNGFNGGNNGGNNNGNNNNNNNNNNGGSPTCLNANAIQTGSTFTGQDSDVPADGQANSATDPANFINFCSGQTVTNGLQITSGSCNGIVMGKIPAKTNMVSTVILNPKLNDELPANTDFNITLTVAHLNLGSFTNATSTYYAAPQDLGGNGNVVGHTHVTVEFVGDSFQFTTPLDPTQFVFFKGINDAGNGAGTVTTAVTGGLPEGKYRVCSMSSASNHQPVLMPVAQRGAQDDCRYFSVTNGGGGGNGGNNNAGNGNAGSGNANNGNGNGNNGNNGNGDGGDDGVTNNASSGDSSNDNSGSSSSSGDNNSGTSTSSSASSSSTTSSDNNNNNNNQGGNRGKGRKNKGGKGKKKSCSGSSPSATSPSNAAAAGSTSDSASAANASATAAASSSSSGSSSSSSSSAIGGIEAPPVVDSGNADRPFEVNGDTFVNKSAAVQRACAVQHNACADAVNAGKVQGEAVQACETQESACNAQA
ncbi:hypothetical protein SPI_04538 [Niveomyces insectorum RCEF 264]|uniref:Ribosomal protein s17 n=1 Tax=Niveomyces insectorum RCEF 264 TaxID=1081102 RepID=A0A167UL44_9HYPO|nr:hypothetical protein SPI_04538 [Niveomyces insectorum RCEF 264]